MVTQLIRKFNLDLAVIALNVLDGSTRKEDVWKVMVKEKVRVRGGVTVCPSHVVIGRFSWCMGPTWERAR